MSGDAVEGFVADGAEDGGAVGGSESEGSLDDSSSVRFSDSDADDALADLLLDGSKGDEDGNPMRVVTAAALSPLVGSPGAGRGGVGGADAAASPGVVSFGEGTLNASTGSLRSGSGRWGSGKWAMETPASPTPQGGGDAGEIEFSLDGRGGSPAEAGEARDMLTATTRHFVKVETPVEEGGHGTMAKDASAASTTLGGSGRLDYRSDGDGSGGELESGQPTNPAGRDIAPDDIAGWFDGDESASSTERHASGDTARASDSETIDSVSSPPVRKTDDVASAVVPTDSSGIGDSVTSTIGAGAGPLLDQRWLASTEATTRVHGSNRNVSVTQSETCDALASRKDGTGEPDVVALPPDVPIHPVPSRCAASGAPNEEHRADVHRSSPEIHYTASPLQGGALRPRANVGRTTGPAATELRLADGLPDTEPESESGRCAPGSDSQDDGGAQCGKQSISGEKSPKVSVQVMQEQLERAVVEISGLRSRVRLLEDSNMQLRRQLSATEKDVHSAVVSKTLQHSRPHQQIELLRRKVQSLEQLIKARDVRLGVLSTTTSDSDPAKSDGGHGGHGDVKAKLLEAQVAELRRAKRLAELDAATKDAQIARLERELRIVSTVSDMLVPPHRRAVTPTRDSDTQSAERPANVSQASAAQRDKTAPLKVLRVSAHPSSCPEPGASPRWAQASVPTDWLRTFADARPSWSAHVRVDGNHQWLQRTQRARSHEKHDVCVTSDDAELDIARRVAGVDTTARNRMGPTLSFAQTDRTPRRVAHVRGSRLLGDSAGQSGGTVTPTPLR